MTRRSFTRDSRASTPSLKCVGEGAAARLTLAAAVSALALAVGPAHVAYGQPAAPNTQPLSVHQQYLAELDKTHAAGLPTAMSAIFPESVPDDQNAYPVYMKILSGAISSQDDAEATRILGSLTASPGNAEWDNGRTFITSHPDDFAIAESAGAKTLCVVADRATSTDPMDMPFPELGQMRKCARFLWLEGLVENQEGKPLEALRTQDLAIHIAGQVYGNPTLIGWLVGAAIEAGTLSNIEQIATAGRSDPAVLAAASRMLASLPAHPLGARLSDEVAFHIADLEYWRTKSPSFINTLVAYADGNQDLLKPAATVAQMTPSQWNDFLDANGITLLELYRQIVTAAAEPYPQASAWFRSTDQALAKLNGYNTMLVRIVCPALANLASKGTKIDGQEMVARAYVAVLTYKTAHGSFPPTLDQAMSSVPVDPVTLQPLEYHQQDGGFLLYSTVTSGSFDGATGTWK